MKSIKLKTLFYLGSFLLFPTFLQAGNWLLILKPVNPFQFGSSQIFTPVTIINNGTISGTARLKVELRTSDGTLLSDFSSGDFEIGPGTIDLGMKAVRLQTSNWYNQELDAFDRKNGSLPSGNYRYCVQLIDAQTAEVLNQCSDITIESLNPAELLQPDDKAELETLVPVQFTWLPCTPVKTSVLYSIKVAELYPDQTPLDAIQRNPAVHQVEGLHNNMYNYPVSANRLMEGKSYAWQIECYEDLSSPELKGRRHSAISSQVYEFRIGKKPKADTIVFATPHRTLTADYCVLNDNRFYFSFRSDYLQGTLDYQILGLDKRPLDVSIYKLDDKWNKSGTPIVLQGENKYVLEFERGMPPEGIYTLVLRDLKGLEYYLKIKVD